MAPRKSTKLAAAPEAEAPEAAPKARIAKAKPRKTQAAPEPAPDVQAAVPAPETPAPAKAGRKPRAPKAAPTPEAVQASEPSPAKVPPPAPSAAPVSVDALFTEPARAVLQAIQEGSAVELTFLESESNPPRTFEPRQLIFDAFAKGWYVWGWDRRYNAERHHLLDLIAQVQPVEGLGRAAQGPYKEGTPANLIGGWLGGEPIRVKVVLFKQWIFAVRQAPAPFPEFRIEEIEEGKAQVTFVATDLRAISRWAMQFGDGIQVIEPLRLQDRIKQVGIAWSGPRAAAERGAAPAPAPQASRPPRDRGHRSEHRPEHRPEHKTEPREAAPERDHERERERERRRPEAPRHVADAPKASKPGKIEIRIDRL